MKILISLLGKLIDFLINLFELRKKSNREKRAIFNMAFKIYSNVFVYDSDILWRMINEFVNFAQKYSEKYNSHYPSEKSVIELQRHCIEIRRLYGHESMPKIPKGDDFDINLGVAIDNARQQIRKLLKSDFKFN